MCSCIPHTKNNIFALCSKHTKNQHAKKLNSGSQGDLLTEIIDYLTKSFTGDTVEEERTSKQMQRDITQLLQMAHQDGQDTSRKNKLETDFKKMAGERPRGTT